MNKNTIGLVTADRDEIFANLPVFSRLLKLERISDVGSDQRS
jgi:hypothetical protein